MSREKLNEQLVMLVFGFAAETVPTSLIEMHVRRPTMPLQSIPQAARHVDGPDRVFSPMAEKERTFEALDFNRHRRKQIVG